MTLIQLDLIPGSGDQLLTYDSQTRLEWLNLTATANCSYLDVLAGLGGFTTTFGLGFATSAQVTALYRHAGVRKFSGPTAAIDNTNHFGIQVLQDLMNGKSMVPLASSDSVSVDTNGMVKYGGSGTPSGLAPIEVRQTHLNLRQPDKSYTDAGAMTQSAGRRSPRVGSYLVRKSRAR